MTMAKGIMIVDGQRVPFDGEKNVLSVIRKAGIDMPTFCYYSELSVHGACRMTSGARSTPPAPWSPGTGWRSAPTPPGCCGTGG